MKGDEEPANPPAPLRDDELCALQQRARQLEARRGRITSKKVYLKSKKVKTRLTRRDKAFEVSGVWSETQCVGHLLSTGDLHHQSQPEDAAAAGRTRAGQLPAGFAEGQTPQNCTHVCRGGKNIPILCCSTDTKNTLVKVLFQVPYTSSKGKHSKVKRCSF